MDSTALSRSDSIVLIPTYNEKENIAAIIHAVFELPRQFHILIIDDNSPDGTGAIVKDLQKQFPGALHLMERTGKQGLGTAYIAGFKWAIEHRYEYIFEMDADFSHNPKDLMNLLAACKTGGADMAIGSRYVTGVNVVNWPMGRVMMSYFASKYVRFVTGMKNTRHDRRIRLLPTSGTRNDRTRLNPIQRICLSNRNEIHNLQIRIHH